MGLYTKVAGAWQEVGVDGGSGMTWAKVSGGTVTEVTNPDGSVDSVHTFTANGTLTVESPGYARVLIVGPAVNQLDLLNAGRIRDGIHALPAGALPVVVGSNSTTTRSALGAIESGQQGSAQANEGTGAGSVPGNRTLGFTSDITGTNVVYAAAENTGTPGSGPLNTPGIVVVRVQKSAPTVSGVAASGGTESTYVGDGTNGVLGQTYKVHKFTTSGTLTVAQGGEVDYFVIGGGGGAVAGTHSGDGGRVAEGTVTVTPGPITVTVGAGGPSGSVAPAGRSALGGINPGAVGTGPGIGAGGGGAANISAGVIRSITGTPVEYGKGAAYPPDPNTGGGYNATTSGPGAAGVVIVRYKVAT